MTRQLTILTAIVATCLAIVAIPARAETPRVKVVGVTVEKTKGNREPARRHEECANNFEDAHWCSTQEYLDGGMAIPADEKLNIAWIRPTIVSTVHTPNYGLVYVDASGLVAIPNTLNCRQWSSNDRNHRGTVLQKREGDDRQIVTIRQCSEELRTLCCAPVIDDF
jgi:hypothetical protein